MPRIVASSWLSMAVLAIAACRGEDAALAPISALTVPGGGLPGFPGTVTDLAVDEVTPNSATLSFTEVDDGLGSAPRYVVRYAEPPIDWGLARDVTEGTCVAPLFGQQVGARLTCTVEGLARSTTYEFQVMAERSTLDLMTVTGGPSNVAQGTTSCDCWTNKAFMPTPRYSLAVADVNGILYAVGGTQGSGRLQSAVEAYDPAADAWTTRAPMPTPRSGLGVAVVDGILYAIGGGGPGAGTAVEAYDPATDTWTTRAPMPTARAVLGVAAVDGVIYAVGGTVDGFSGLTTLEAYDPAIDSWTTKAPMPTGRYWHGVAAVNGLLYVVGGNNESGGLTGLATVEAYDPVTDTWATRVPMPTALRQVGATAMDGLIYAEDARSQIRLKALRAYNPATNSWTERAPMPTFDTIEMGSFGVGAVGGMLYAVGGNDFRGYVKAYQP